MPSIVIEIPEQYDSVSRSVQFSVIEHVRRITGLDVNIDRQINPEETDYPQPGSTMESMNQFGGKVSFPYTDKITVSVREEYQQDFTLTNPVRRPEHQVIFKDSALGVDIYPSYQWVQMNMEIEVRFKDRATAMKWYSGFQRALSQRRAQQTHTVLYHYPVPEPFLIILQEIHRLRETQGGYGDALTQYVSQFGSKNLTSIVNQAGNNDTVVVKETQHEIVGNFEFEAAVPKPEPNARDGAHFCQFTYTVWYNKPTSVVMKYPNMIHNQFMPPDMLDFDRGYDRDQLLAASGSLGYEAQQRLLKQTGMSFSSGEGYKGLPVPYWDDWLPRYLHPGEVTIMRILTMMDTQDPTLVLNLQELGDYELDPLLVDFLLEDPESLITPLGSPVRLYLYRGHSPLWGDVLNVSEDLTVRSNDPLNIRELYHVVTTIQYDLKLLTNTCLKRMIRHGAFTRKLLVCLASNIEKMGLLPALKSDGTLDSAAFYKAIDYIHDRPHGRAAQFEYAFRLVGAFTVNAESKSA